MIKKYKIFIKKNRTAFFQATGCDMDYTGKHLNVTLEATLND